LDLELAEEWVLVLVPGLVLEKLGEWSVLVEVGELVGG
jgi:hypothetical protein